MAKRKMAAPGRRRVLKKLTLCMTLCAALFMLLWGGSTVVRRGRAQSSVQSVVWVNAVNATANGGSLQKSGGCSCYDAGAVSLQQFTGAGGYLEFSPSPTGRMFVGLGNDTDSATDYDNINYAFNFWGNGDFDIREGWANWRAGGNYAAGDTFRIAIEGGVVKYYKNGALLYTSTVAPSYPLVVDTALVELNAAVNNATVSVPTAGIKTDRGVYPEPPLPTLPATAGGKFFDPTFGTEIMRATDANDAPAPGLGNFYSYWPTFNSDNTYILIRKGTDGTGLVKPFDATQFTVGEGYQPPLVHDAVRNINFPINFEGAMWHPTDPLLIYCIPNAQDGGLRLYTYNVETHGYNPIKDFSSLGTSSDYFKQMSMSADGDVFSWSHMRVGSSDPVYYLVWRKSTDTVLYHTPTNGTIDEVGLDKSGRYLSIAYKDDGLLEPDEEVGKYLDLQTGVADVIRWNASDNPAGHSDFGTGIQVGTDPFGGGVLIKPLSNIHAHTQVFDFKNEDGFVDWTEHKHLSMTARDENWVTVSTYDAFNSTDTDYHIFENEIFQIALDGSQRVRRICHTRTFWNADDSANTGYRSLATANVSRDGRFIAFTSNWEASGRTDLFIARIEPAPPLLASPWTSQDIGSVGLTGSAHGDGSNFTVTGSGTDIWSGSDSFRFTYVPLNGDGQIVARLTDIQNVNAATKAGVMIREAVPAADARHAMLDITVAGGMEFIYRTAPAGESFWAGGSYLTAPYWLKMVRSGNVFRSYVSPDGISWTQVGQDVTINMSSNVYVGLAVTSHDNAALCTATFDHVSVITP